MHASFWQRLRVAWHVLKNKPTVFNCDLARWVEFEPGSNDVLFSDNRVGMRGNIAIPGIAISGSEVMV